LARLHLLHTSLPFTHSLKLPTDPFPQKITGRVRGCRLSPLPLADGTVLVTGTYEVVIDYTNLEGEKKKIREILSLEERIPVPTCPDLPNLPQKLAPGEKWELAANIPAPRVRVEPIRIQETVTTRRGTNSFSLTPRAVSVQIEGALVLDGWLHNAKGTGGQEEKDQDGKQPRDRHDPSQSPPLPAYDNRGIQREKKVPNKGGIEMMEEVQPAALRNTAEEGPGPETGPVGPAVLRYGADIAETEAGAAPEPPGEETKPSAPQADEGETPPTRQAAAPKRTKPTPYYRLPSSKGPGNKKGSDLMAGRKVTLKVEDLLRAGRSHFEIPKSKQEALKKKASRRGG